MCFNDFVDFCKPRETGAAFILTHRVGLSPPKRVGVLSPQRELVGVSLTVSPTLCVRVSHMSRSSPNARFRFPDTIGVRAPDTVGGWGRGGRSKPPLEVPPLEVPPLEDKKWSFAAKRGVSQKVGHCEAPASYFPGACGIRQAYISLTDSPKEAVPYLRIHTLSICFVYFAGWGAVPGGMRFLR